MTHKFFKIFFFILSLVGVVFSGYVSGVKMFSKICAFGETCPLVFGVPACYFGFILFLILFVLSIVFISGKGKLQILSKLWFWVALVGVLFSGYFALEEVPLFLNSGFGAYVFGLPTCILGFLFFLAIFISSIFFQARVEDNTL